LTIHSTSYFLVAAEIMIITGSTTNTSKIQMIITPPTLLISWRWFLRPLDCPNFWDHPRVCGKDFVVVWIL